MVGISSEELHIMYSLMAFDCQEIKGLLTYLHPELFCLTLVSLVGGLHSLSAFQLLYVLYLNTNIIYV